MAAIVRGLLVTTGRPFALCCANSAPTRFISPWVSASPTPKRALTSRRWSSNATPPPQTPAQHQTATAPAPSQEPAQPPMTFSYSVAASYIGKDRPYNPATHVFHFNPHNRILPDQARNKRLRPESGQDAFFVSRVGDTDGVALGVADGVGGWMDSGVDPADFSHGLCGNMASFAYSYRAPKPTESPQKPQAAQAQALTPRRLMQLGYDALCADGSIPAGGSTAVVGTLSPDGTLEVANLGDSGFVQLRANAVHAASAPQIHAFNTPFQLSVVPPSIMARMAVFGGAQLSDMPRDAEVTRHRLRHGDVLVFASDGVWDNLFNQDILRVVCRAMAAVGAWEATEQGTRVRPDLSALTVPAAAAEGAAEPSATTLQSLLATQITAAAKAASVNTKLDGPFAKEVKKYYPRETWRGGKIDDICVVVVVVSETSGSDLAESTAPKLKSRL
ncbi:hypothetical protein GGTG_10187 [Gaeumannomyces tritici R3-111a-1]|uniref:Protein phosphatase n=1 Tax=Gaeumannomyces tritici (strain R3-111a-1) TaxID=644352 RepID=J3P9K7_GAET3|nr:hypothetical protein GGTG_10187 [Gaeumannomyces tritici R3-111a-1]EJT73343.1 hypothetical protein GGTG_10187 [Gaeumannomyces tritici R3-111a-1]